jgi:hypothetical protein
MTTQTDISSLDLGGLDLLIVAVGPNDIRGVLTELAKKSGRSRVVLMMDTPPVRLLDVIKLGKFRGYRQVCVGEDWVRLSPVMTIRNMIQRGDVGVLRSIRLDHLGYRYHGLATLREISGTSTVASIRHRLLRGDGAVTLMKLGRGATATMIEPRNYNTGQMIVCGSTAAIGWSMGDEYIDCDIRIACPDTGAGWYQPISMNGALQPPDAVESFMAKNSLDYLGDRTRMNRLKIRGYARLVEDIAQGRQAYPIGEGLYDYLAVSTAEITGRFFDLSFGGSRKGVVRRFMDLH